MATSTPSKTTLDTSTTKPSTTAPGDGPADTTDPTEIATSVTPQPGAEAFAAGTVNAVKPVKQVAPEKSEAEPRIERFSTVNPAGEKVTVERNIDTGDSKLVD